MKSERRHELQHNQLADALGKWVEKLKPYARLIGGIAVLLFVLGVAYAYVSGKSEQMSVAGWDEYFAAIEANDRGRLTDVAEKYPGTKVAAASRVVAADMALSDGCMGLFTSKAEARELLRQAVDNYLTVVKDSTDDSLKQRALFGLGRAHESLASLDDLEKARKEYKELLDGWPKGVYAKAAQQRLDDLERNSTKRFYDWFAQYKPPTKAGPSGSKPDFLKEPDAADGLDLPSLFDDAKPDGPALQDTPPADAPAPPTDPPSDAAPEETPADTEPLVEEPPAESPPDDDAKDAAPDAADPPADQGEK